MPWIIALIADAALSGPLAALCFAVGGTLAGIAAYTALCPDKADACPTPCWRKGDDTATQDEPPPAVTQHAPQPIRPWPAGVNHAAPALAAKRRR